MPSISPEGQKHRHEVLKRIAEASRRRSLEWHGPYTPNPEPPGEGEWNTVLEDIETFAAAGLCELWRMDLGDKTAFFRHSDFPPGFNFSGMWWRKA